jgi:hypothetical protein
MNSKNAGGTAMRSFESKRAGALLLGVVTAVLILPGASQATIPKPQVATGGAAHVGVSSAQLTAVINPRGTATSYYFQYGPTVTYGKQTPTVNVGAGFVKVKVGQEILGLLPSVLYHYRVVGIYGGVPVFGKDRTFTVKGARAKIELQKLTSVTAGTPFVLSGALRGIGNANRRVGLQASPYPFLEPFADIGLPATTNAAGSFAFRVANLTATTEFRASTQDLRPLISTTVTVHAAVRVTLHVRSSKQVGLVRVYGTITPAVSSGRVELQVEKAIRPNKKEETSRFVSQFVTSVKRATHSASRFSAIVRVIHGGRYRAFVRLKGGGPLVSGFSTQTVTLHAAPGGSRKAPLKH